MKVSTMKPGRFEFLHMPHAEAIDEFIAVAVGAQTKFTTQPF
jgi:hypothetical protein